MAYDHIKIMTSLKESGVWRDLSPNALKVYCELCACYNWKKRKSYPSIKHMSRSSGVSERSVYSAVTELCKLGLIIKRKEENPLGYDFNYYIIPDYLVKELQDIERKKNITPTAKSAVATAISALLPAKSGKALLQNLHINYIVKNYVNRQGDLKPKGERGTMKRWTERPSHISGEIDKLLGKGK